MSSFADLMSLYADRPVADDFAPRSFFTAYDDYPTFDGPVNGVAAALEVYGEALLLYYDSTTSTLRLI